MKDTTALYKKMASKAYAVYPGCINAIKVAVLPVSAEAEKKHVERIVAQYVVKMPAWSKVAKGHPELQVNYNSYTNSEKPGRLIIINFQTSLSAN